MDALPPKGRERFKVKALMTSPGAVIHPAKGQSQETQAVLWPRTHTAQEGGVLKQLTNALDPVSASASWDRSKGIDCVSSA